MPDWIACKVRMPEDDVNVLFMTSGFAGSAISVLCGKHLTGAISVWTDGFGAWRDFEVSHWMPLPEAVIPLSTVKLVRESTREKSEKYICTACAKACYYPHSRNKIPYKFCPNCGERFREGDDNHAG